MKQDIFDRISEFCSRKNLEMMETRRIRPIEDYTFEELKEIHRQKSGFYDKKKEPVWLDMIGEMQSFSPSAFQRLNRMMQDQVIMNVSNRGFTYNGTGTGRGDGIELMSQSHPRNASGLLQ